MSKRVLATILGALLSAALFAGCGGGGGSTPTALPTVAPTSAPANTNASSITVPESGIPSPSPSFVPVGFSVPIPQCVPGGLIAEVYQNQIALQSCNVAAGDVLTASSSNSAMTIATLGPFWFVNGSGTTTISIVDTTNGDSTSLTLSR